MSHLLGRGQHLRLPGDDRLSGSVETGAVETRLARSSCLSRTVTRAVIASSTRTGRRKRSDWAR